MTLAALAPTKVRCLHWVAAFFGAAAGATLIAWQYPARLGAIGWAVVLLAACLGVGALLQAASPLVLRRLPTLRLALAGGGVFVIGTISFWLTDFRHNEYFATGWPLGAYNLWRLLLLAFLFAILRGAGWGVRRQIERRFNTDLTQSASERIVLDLAIGAATCVVVMFALGCAGLLYRPLILVLAAPLCVLGLRAISIDMRSIAVSRGRERDLVANALLLLALVILALLLIIIGLANIAEEYDASHYLPYYEAVARNHGLTPNEYWYHFWITKGAGLQILASLLGDVFTASLAGFAALCVTAGVVALYLRRALPGSRAFAAAGAIAFLCPFVYAFHNQQKQHYVVMALFAAAVWTASWLARPGVKTFAPGLVVLALLCAAAIICTTPMAAVVGLFLGLFALAAVFAAPPAHRWSTFARAALPAVIAGGVATVVLVLNYIWIGMSEATPFRLFLDHADQTRMAHYISPYLWLFLGEGTASDTGKILSNTLTHIRWSDTWVVLNFQVYGLSTHALAVILASGAAAMFAVPVRKRLGWPFICLALSLACAWLVTKFVSQPGSLARLYVFTIPLSTMTLGLAASALFTLIGGKSNLKSALAACTASGLLAVYAPSLAIPTYASKVGFRALSCQHGADSAFSSFACQVRFLAGGLSLADQTGVMPACRRLADFFGAAHGEKVWSVNFVMPVGCFLLPAPQLLMEVSAGFGPSWHRMVFGDAATARRALNQEGVRYFHLDVTTFDSEKSPSSSIFGCMAYSPLFAPDAVATRFRVVLREGDAFLLTFSDLAPNAPRLPADFPARWAAHRDKPQPAGQMKEMCARVGAYYQAQAERWPVRADPTLPKLQGWQ